MDMLIIGGLITIGMLALASAVYLSLNTSSLKIAADTRLPASSNVEGVKVENAEPGQQETAVTPVGEQIFSMYRELGPITPLRNGQLHELATGLRALHQKSQELSQRLGFLAEIANHMERTQNRNSSGSEDEVNSR